VGGANKLKAFNWGSQRVEWAYNGHVQRVLETLNGVASKGFIWGGADMLLEKNAAHTITKNSTEMVSSESAGQTRKAASIPQI
jgi:hypothetical protein